MQQGEVMKHTSQLREYFRSDTVFRNDKVAGNTVVKLAILMSTIWYPGEPGISGT